MAKLRAPVAQRPFIGARRLGWAVPLIGACSVYDPSLLVTEASAGSQGSGLATSGGDAPTSGGRVGSEGGHTSTEGGSEGGAPEETGGTDAGGAPSTGGKANSQGGTTPTGGASATGSATGTGGSVATGGTSTTGGTPSKGGTTSTGGSSGGSVSATGGASTTGGTPSKGGATSTGGSSGGSVATGGTAGSGGAGGCSGGDCCPSDPNKTMPGVCGCGVPDQDSGTTAGCVGLRNALVHRYSFSGSGTRATDSVGGEHGTVTNTTLTNTGSLSLAGTTSDQYVDLPNGIVSSLTNATFDVWLTWTGGSGWQRIFDFGNSSAAEGTQGNGDTYLFLTPKGTSGSAYLRVVFSTEGTANETFVNAAAALATSTVSHVTVVVDDTNALLSLYLNGTSAGSAAFTESLSGLNDVNNWLGRSQFSPDAEFAGQLHELRIYKVALSAAQIQLSQQAGTDPAFF
jgi:hypothetical protein